MLSILLKAKNALNFTFWESYFNNFLKKFSRTLDPDIMRPKLLIMSL